MYRRKSFKNIFTKALILNKKRMNNSKNFATIYTGDKKFIWIEKSNNSESISKKFSARDWISWYERNF